ncbi:hypothetical protein K474DRAFT_1016772 [Panus rudis PR-1116 ss-1]|nr:hypothetical protein K474DRAFT_1016772 [Panus rudis PR-1116 ss-1]
MLRPPTCAGIQVRDIDEANCIFHAVSLGQLYLYSQRLSIEERRSIHTGCVFVWEERSSSGESNGEGLERWTDGRRWSCSKVKNDFLFYQEKLPEIKDDLVVAALLPNQLVKQTYSVYVQTPRGRRKWHLVAYYTPETRDHLRTIDDIPSLSQLRGTVPVGAYKQARVPRTRARAMQLQHPQELPHTSLRSSSSSSPTVPDQQTTFYHQSNYFPSLRSPSTPEMLPGFVHVDMDEVETDGSVREMTGTPPPVMSDSPTFPRSDPQWILQNCVAITTIPRARSRSVVDESKDLAPLLYMQDSPWPPRQPFDVDILRSFDVAPWV